MSRARPVVFGDEEIWFDTLKNGERAKADHLELLALVEKIDIDDLLDEHITQGSVIERLRNALGQNTIPDQILEKRAKWREARRVAPKCRICTKEHNSTKHHFVNKWILKELKSYARKWSDRAINTIPVCMDCHRDLHMRSGPAKSIAQYLTDTEKEFAEAALMAFVEQRERVAWLIALGDDSVYESRLMKDFVNGHFRIEAEIVTPAQAREVIAG